MTIALLHPGDMGAAIGRELVDAGNVVRWVDAGRSPASGSRARASGLVGIRTLEDALDGAEVVLSIVPPQAALDVARAIAATGYRGVVVDANAIAPQTAHEAAAAVQAAGARFVDGGIIGPPPREAGTTRLYLSGDLAQATAALFAPTRVEAIAIDGGIGAASALKACYAAWNKGSIALLTAIRALAHEHGCDAALLAEWERSQTGIAARSGAIVRESYKAWRWAPEMEEIASSFDAAGLPGGFHLAAAEVFMRLATFKDEPAGSLDEVLATLRSGRPLRD